MSKYAYTGLAPGVLADGRPLAPGQRDIPLSSKDLENPDNLLLIGDGVLQEIPAAQTSKAVSK